MCSCEGIQIGPESPNSRELSLKPHYKNVRLVGVPITFWRRPPFEKPAILLLLADHSAFYSLSMGDLMLLKGASLTLITRLVEELRTRHSRVIVIAN